MTDLLAISIAVTVVVVAIMVEEWRNLTRTVKWIEQGERARGNVRRGVR